MASLHLASPSSPSCLSTLTKPLLSFRCRTTTTTPPSTSIYFSSSSLSKPARPDPVIKNLKPAATFRSFAARISDEPAAPQALKSRLKDGETLYGLFLLSFSPTVAEIGGLAGYDFVVVDMEHGYGGISDALPCLHALAATGTPAILRLPESDPTWAKKALDLGPQGIMFPMIESPEAAQKAVSYCRFPPRGVRGSAHTVVRASGYGIDAGCYLSNYEEGMLIMCQVESEEGVKKVEEIAAVEGVDCIQMGPLDLSASMGYLWDPGNKRVREVMRVAERGVLDGSGAYLGGFAMPHDSPGDLRARGYQMVSGAVDVGLFRSAAVDDVKRFKMSLGGRADSHDYSGDEGDSENHNEEKYWSE